MMRACHLNTCPVGIATQDPELRKRFAGEPEHVVNFMFFVAEEARRIMARLGVRKFEDLVGRVDLLEADEAIERWKERGIDLSALLHAPDVPADVAVRRVRPQVSPLADALDWQLIEQARPAIEDGTPVEAELDVRNVNRTVGGLLSHAVTKAHGAAGLPPGSIRFTLRGSAGQSFGAWLAPGIELDAGRRRERLRRQGPLRRRPGGAAARRLRVRRRGERDHRQHRSLRRHRRQGVLPRPGRRAVRRSQLRASRRRRGSRRPRLRVHDRRPRRRARPDRAELRGRHERRHRLRARRGRQVPRPLQRGAGRLRGAQRGRRRRGARARGGARRAHGLRGRRAPARRLDERRAEVHQGRCRTTTSARSPTTTSNRGATIRCRRAAAS